MKRILFFIAIAMCYTVTNSNAQELECRFCGPKLQSKTKANFNATFVNHRHIVTLEKGNKMIVEMYNTKDYDMLKDVGSLLTAFKNAIEPLKDSLATAPSDHLRVDYSYTDAADYRKIRIKKYSSDGSLFISDKNTISPLKVEQDTVRILIEKKAYYNYNGVEYKNYRPVQLTFIVNNYTDIDGLIKDQATLQHFIDTMQQVATPKRDVWVTNYKTTINFHPYPDALERFSGKYRFIFIDGILTDEYTNIAWMSKYVTPATWAFIADMGAGITRGRLSTTAEAGLEYRSPKKRGGQFVTIARVTVAPYFLFDRTPAGNVGLYDNWFVNLEAGTLSREEGNDFVFKKETIGIGYLLKANGPYFSGTTMKAYLNFPLNQQFVICPEVIATNDFHTIFPAITFKGFLARD